MDPSVLPLSPDGDATAQASPAVAMMRAAAEAKKRALDQTALQNQYKQAEEARMQTQGDLAEARERRIATQDQNAMDTQTMGNDLSQWSQDPSQSQYRTSWDQAPAEVKQHVNQAYPNAVAAAPRIWNNAVTQNTGTQVGVPITPPTTAQILHASSQGVEHTPGESADDLAAKVTSAAQAKANGVPSNIRTQLANLGKWRNGMSLEEAGDTLNQAYVDNGTIPPQHVPAAIKLMTAIQHDKVIAPFAAQKDAYDALKTGFQNPQSGGYGDMAMIEGLQRILNPGATVRQATIQNMKDAQGWLQNLDPHFQWQKATQGDKLSPEAKQRIMQLADAKFSQSEREAQRSLAGKRLAAGMLGIPPQLAGPLVDNLITYVGRGQQLDESGIPVDGQPAQGQQQPQAPNAAPAQTPASAQVPKVASRADFDALPKGAHYIGSNGTEYIKP